MAIQIKKCINQKIKKKWQQNHWRTFQFHAGVETFFETAGRTFFAGGDGDGTGGAPQAHVVFLILDGPFEESFAALARENAVVEARDFVAANRTRAVD